jgi:hypothetical protein
MKLVTGLLAAVLLMAGMGASHAVVRIADDRGGRIGTYVDKYQGLRTSLGFHAAWDFGANGRAITNREATQMLYSMYPTPVRRWIAQRGGLKSQMIFLRGKQLQAMYKPCYLDAQAAPRPSSRRGRAVGQREVIGPDAATLARQPD